MKTPRKTILLGSLVAISLGLSGCLFPGSVSVTISEITGFVFISVGGVEVGTCFEEEDRSSYPCFFNDISSFVNMTLPELIFRLVVLDPLVVQFPADVTDFSGSFLHNDSGDSGPLEIMPGLSSVKIDVDRTLTAEAGSQLVVIGLPEDAPTLGTFSFNMNFQVPEGTTAIEVKPLITGLVELTDGSVFYPPLLPCVDDLADTPALKIPLPVPGDTLFFPPLTPDLGCDNVTYHIVPASAG